MFNGLKSYFSNSILKNDFNYLVEDVINDTYFDFIWFLYDIRLNNKVNWNDFVLVSLFLVFARPKQLLDGIN